MNNRKQRREFLKQGVTAGAALAIGGIGLSGCSKSSLESKTTTDSDIDFSRIAYCCINCDECPLYKATLDNDKQAKKKIAEQWGDSKKPNFKLEEFYCYGCKDERSKGTPGQGCTVRKCAIKKGFATCAQCGDFEDCDNKLWRDFPQIRDGVHNMKAKLGIT